jgi:para-aminobenzoate synthetase/4-amino-4-deoxychorismate lyase
VSNKDALPTIIISRQPVLSQSPFLYHKTTNRPLYTNERANALQESCLEVIFENERGEITEGSISSIFIQVKNTYYTPPVKCGLLPGIFRAHLLEKHANLIQEKILFRENLQNADAIFIANSVRGLIKVTLKKTSGNI